MSASKFKAVKRPLSPMEEVVSYINWDDINWVDKFEPKNIKDVGISTVIMNQVKDAIEKSSIFGGKTKLLIFTGPTGCGKSTLIKILCKDYNFQLIEWITPGRDWSARLGHIETFKQFLAKATAYKTLDNENREIAGKVVLLDDVPDLTHDSVALEYVSVLREFLDYKKKFLIVLIATDAYAYDNKGKDNLARIIAPTSLKEDKRVTTINFLPIAKFTMRKIIFDIRNRTGVEVSRDYIENLIDISNRDIRLAINNLQFDSIANHKKAISGKRAKLSNSILPHTSFSARTSHWTISQAVKKVLSANRNDDGTLKTKPEEIINKSPIDNDYLIDFIQYNCIDSLHDIDDISNALQDISLADNIRSEFDYGDEVADYSRVYISITSIMKNKRCFFNKPINLNNPIFLKTKSDAHERARKEYYEEYMSSVLSRQAYWKKIINKEADDE